MVFVLVSRSRSVVPDELVTQDKGVCASSSVLCKVSIQYGSVFVSPFISTFSIVCKIPLLARARAARPSARATIGYLVYNF